jgi:GNAT superfamily N-acetyltransferase
MLATAPSSFCAVAECEEGVIGYVAATTTEHGCHVVRDLYASRRDTGVGSLLLEKALEWHGEKESIRVEIPASCNDAIRFYERHGFIVMGLVPASPISPVLRRPFELLWMTRPGNGAPTPVKTRNPR